MTDRGEHVSQAYGRLEWHLTNWAEWMASGGATRLGWGQTVLAISGSLSFDDMVRKMDRKSAAIMDTLIEELPTLEKAAIHQSYLGTRLFDSDEELMPAMERACRYLEARMDDKGLM